MNRSLRRVCVLSVAAVGIVFGVAAIEVVGDANVHTIILSNRTVVVATASGKISVTEAGVIELLAVGGGGGGGEGYTHTNDKYYYGGGGGAGGVVHIESLEVAAGEYDVVIGAGGAVGSNGGNTTVFGQTAFGGGRGAKGMGLNMATSGASGGGGARNYYNDGRSGSNGAEAKAEYLAAPYLNLGNNGANAPNTACMSGGGGGAGGAASGANPGVAYLCSITGEEVVEGRTTRKTTPRRTTVHTRTGAAAALAVWCAAPASSSRTAFTRLWSGPEGRSMTVRRRMCAASPARSVTCARSRRASPTRRPWRLYWRTAREEQRGDCPPQMEMFSLYGTNDVVPSPPPAFRTGMFMWITLRMLPMMKL